MKTLIVPVHPRANSLTHAVARSFADAATGNGHAIEWADLYAEGFDPRLGPEDEPDWDNPDKVYSAAVRSEMARIERNDATVMVFPVWWWSMPAMAKGWIDRVWNRGWAYDGRYLPQSRVWMLAVAGGDEAAFTKRKYDEAMRTQIGTGVLGYCHVAEPRFEMLYGALDGGEQVAAILRRAEELGREF